MGRSKDEMWAGIFSGLGKGMSGYSKARMQNQLFELRTRQQREEEEQNRKLFRLMVGRFEEAKRQGAARSGYYDARARAAEPSLMKTWFPKGVGGAVKDISAATDKWRELFFPKDERTPSMKEHDWMARFFPKMKREERLARSGMGLPAERAGGSTQTADERNFLWRQRYWVDNGLPEKQAKEKAYQDVTSLRSNVAFRDAAAQWDAGLKWADDVLSKSLDIQNRLVSREEEPARPFTRAQIDQAQGIYKGYGDWLNSQIAPSVPSAAGQPPPAGAGTVPMELIEAMQGITDPELRDAVWKDVEAGVPVDQIIKALNEAQVAGGL